MGVPAWREVWGLSGVPRIAVPTEMGDSSEGWGSWGASCVDSLWDGEQGAAPRAVASPRGFGFLAPAPRVEQNVKASGDLNYYL